MNAEQIRLNEQYSGKKSWLKWGPYVSERQWGTVREDYSATGDSWNFVTHDMAR
ncbi:MAG: glucosidase, partial [Daejeonella sp.]|nr:glucosidase [Daejeonella sp.]